MSITFKGNEPNKTITTAGKVVPAPKKPKEIKPIITSGVVAPKPEPEIKQNQTILSGKVAPKPKSKDVAFVDKLMNKYGKKGIFAAAIVGVAASIYAIVKLNQHK